MCRWPCFHTWRISSICVTEGGTRARGRERASSNFTLRTMVFLKWSSASWRTDGSLPCTHGQKWQWNNGRHSQHRAAKTRAIKTDEDRWGYISATIREEKRNDCLSNDFPARMLPIKIAKLCAVSSRTKNTRLWWSCTWTGWKMACSMERTSQKKKSQVSARESSNFWPAKAKQTSAQASLDFISSFRSIAHTFVEAYLVSQDDHALG